MKRLISMRISEADYKLLLQIAKSEQRSQAEIFSRALELYIAMKGKK